jgi:hypothetical protein
MQHISRASTTSQSDLFLAPPRQKKQKVTKKDRKAPSEKIANTFRTTIIQGERATSESKRPGTHHSHSRNRRKHSKKNNREAARELVIKHHKDPVSTLTSPKSTVIQTPIPKKGKKRAWEIIKCVAGETYKAITYNGQKDVSLKPKHMATRVAAVALPFLQYLIPQTQIVTGVFKACYQIAQMSGAVDKDKTAKKKTLKGAIESPLTRTILGVAVVVAAFFASRVAIVICSALKIGLDVMDLRNSIVSDGFTKDTVLILIKLAGSVAYLALAIFDSNIALIFSISAKLANNVFTAYCEASQGRYVEAIAALVFGCLSNLSNIESVSASVKDDTLLQIGTVILSAQDMAGVTNMNPADMSPSEKIAAEKRKKLSAVPTIKHRKKSNSLDDEEITALKRNRLPNRLTARKNPEMITKIPVKLGWTIPLYI